MSKYKLTEYQLGILGGGGVGKSALTLQMIENHFYENIFDGHKHNKGPYYKQITVDGEKVSINILDSASCEKYTAMRDQQINNGQAFLLVYDITSSATFDEITYFIEQIERIKDSVQVPMIIVGNKCDLEDDRCVETKQLEDFAKSLSCLYFETSAKSNINVQPAFYELVRQIKLDNDNNNNGSKPKMKSDENKCYLV